ncbi:uncharacterized protein LOC103979457 isoform X7 [Musa acuminata AAA Group]|uniref:uncharacterized protein LOC135584230 isoform X7 n=1 Tax=Musa acuminata AAA Group TaxID=214697 RepID=UPI0031D7B9C3
MMMSSSQRHAYSYGDALYWDARYLADGSASFDWYQRYSALRPFVRKYVPVSARVLMVGCGNAVWHGCSTQCFSDARRSEQASQTWRDLYVGKYLFLSKSCDITYGDPSVRIPHLNQPGCNWKIILYIIPRPGFQSPRGDSRPRSIMEPVPLTESGQLPAGFVLEDPDSHYIYVSSYIPKLLLLRKTRQQSR